MGYLAEVTSKFTLRGGGRETGILTLLELAKKFGGRSIDMDLDKIVETWRAAYEKENTRRAFSKPNKEQIDHYLKGLEAALADWKKRRSQKGAEIKPGEEIANAATVENALKTLYNLEMLGQDRAQEFRDAASTVLRIAAAELWNKDRAYVGNEPEPLKTTVEKLNTAIECEPAFAAADLPKSLQLDPQENPGKYLSSKYEKLNLTAGARESLVKISGLLEKLHDPKLNPKQRQENLKELSASIKEMAANKKLGDDRMTLPLVAEATREALGLARGPRDVKAADKPSRPMTDPERKNLSDDERRKRK